MISASEEVDFLFKSMGGLSFVINRCLLHKVLPTCFAGKPPKHSLRKRSSVINMVDKLFAKQNSKGSQPKERRAVRFTPLG